MSADAAMAGVEKMMMAMPDTLDHGAVAAKYTAQAQALEEKAAMHNIPGQGSRSRHLALLWEEMSARYSHPAEAARKIAQIQLELAPRGGT